MLRKGPLCFLSFLSSTHCWQQEWCLLQVCRLPFLCLCSRSLSPHIFFFFPALRILKLESWVVSTPFIIVSTCCCPSIQHPLDSLASSSVSSPPLHSNVVHFTISHALETRKTKAACPASTLFWVAQSQGAGFSRSSLVAEFQRLAIQEAVQDFVQKRGALKALLLSDMFFPECACPTRAWWILDHLWRYSLSSSLASCTHSNLDTCDFLLSFSSFFLFGCI